MLKSQGPAASPARCRTHHPRINAAAALLRRALAMSRVPPYDEATQSGLLRYCQLTALPSRPGGRAEDDGEAQIQVKG
jgi:tRNA/tmRNA/rRNA uracil-C5-methylase (TrmA/RlmC/RlmD family)